MEYFCCISAKVRNSWYTAIFRVEELWAASYFENKKEVVIYGKIFVYKGVRS